MPDTPDSAFRSILERSDVSLDRFPVCLVILRGDARRWWRWSRYNDTFAIVTPDNVFRYTGNTKPTRQAPKASRWPAYTLDPGILYMGFGEDPHRYPSKVLRQAQRTVATEKDGTKTRGFIQFMIHPGPESFGCFTLPPDTFPSFYNVLADVCIGYGNEKGYTDAGLYAPDIVGTTTIVPMIHPA